VNFGPALARWLPANTLGPNTARRAGHLLAPPGIERDDAAMSSTATGTRSRWCPLPHKPISVGAEALYCFGPLVCSVVEVQSTAEAKLPLRRSILAAPHCLAPGELLVEVLRASSRRFEMNPLLMVYFSAGISFAGLGLLKLQAQLERWAYQRHVED
jgi:hypothetical protein